MALDVSREEALIALDRADAQASFARFARMAWHVVEPNPLRWTWHMDAVCEHLEAVSYGYIKNLVISQPPGTSKSLLASTLWNAWDWIRWPTRRTIAATYGQGLSDKNAKLLRDLIQSEWYQRRFGHLVRIGAGDVAKVRLFKLQSQGWRMSTSIQGVATGWHADIHIGDDLAKAQDAQGKAAIDPVAIEKGNEFWFKTLATRRADAAELRRVLIGQRLHHEDAPGAALEQGYTGLILPMEYDPKRRTVTSLGLGRTWEDPRTEPGQLLCPERFPQEVVDYDRTTLLGPRDHEAQNNQNPTPEQGLLFRDVGRMRWEAKPTSARTIITVDAAFKATSSSDFVSIQVWAVKDGKYYLLANDTRRLNFGATCGAISAMAERFPEATGIYIEDKANGPAIIETLSATMAGIVPWSPGTASKESRAEAVAPLFEAGSVLLPPDREAPWIQSYIVELAKFPLTKHDDQVDATTMALLILHQARHSRYAAAVARMRNGT